MENNNKTTQGQQSLNLLEVAARKQAAFTKTLLNETGYNTFTTFYSDLSIAEAFGPDAIRETCQRVTKEWAGNYKYFTEFVLALNWKIWEWNDKNDVLAEVFNECWHAAAAIADQWTGEAAEYYFNITD